MNMLMIHITSEHKAEDSEIVSLYTVIHFHI